MPPARQRDGGRKGTPESMPEGTPSLATPLDHSWTLQAVMEMQKAIGILGEKVDRLSSDISALGTKLDTNCDAVNKINHRLALVAGGAAVIVVVAGIIWSIATIVPWDRISIAPAKADPPITAESPIDANASGVPR